jgi:hypothetical protein
VIFGMVRHLLPSCRNRAVPWRNGSIIVEGA